MDITVYVDGVTWDGCEACYAYLFPRVPSFAQIAGRGADDFAKITDYRIVKNLGSGHTIVYHSEVLNVG